MEVNGKKYSFEAWLNDDIIFIFGWTIHLTNWLFDD